MPLIEKNTKLESVLQISVEKNGEAFLSGYWIRSTFSTTMTPCSSYRNFSNSFSRFAGRKLLLRPAVVFIVYFGGLRGIT